MSTMVLRAAPQSKFTGFSRFAHSLAVLFDVFAEAQKVATEAHRRYPFGRW